VAKNYVLCLERKEILHVPNTSRGIVNRKIETKKIPEVFLLNRSLRVAVYKAPDGGLEAANTK
jgi:hypothetical protein